MISKSKIFIFIILFVFIGTPTAIYVSYLLMDRLCKDEGGLQTKGSLYVSGFLYSRYFPNRIYSFMDYAELLVKDGYEYIEAERYLPDSPKEWQRNRPSEYGYLDRYAKNEGEKYYRYYISRADEPACEGFNRETNRKKDEWKLNALYKWGLNKDECIASVIVDDLKSKYEFTFERNTSFLGLYEANINKTIIREIENQNEHASITSFYVCYFGKIRNADTSWRCRSFGKIKSYKCPSVEIRETAYNEIFNNILFSLKRRENDNEL